MTNEALLFAVEIGRRTVRVTAGSAGARGVTIAGQGTCRARGVREDGLLVDPLQLAEAVRSALAEAEDEAGSRADRVWAAIPATALKSVQATGRVRLGDGQNGSLGARRAQELALASLDSGMTLLHTRLVRVTVEPIRGTESDDTPATDLDFAATYEVLGVHASDLAPYRRAIELVGLDVDAITAAPIAAAHASLTAGEWERGAVLLHADGGVVDLLVCRNGSVQHATTTTMGHLGTELERLGGLDLMPGAIVLSGEGADDAGLDAREGFVVPVRRAAAPPPAQRGAPMTAALAPCVGLLLQSADSLAPRQLTLLATA
jgi:cell division protein FtsA